MSNDKTKWIFDEEPASNRGGGEMTETLGPATDNATQVGNNEPTVGLTGGLGLAEKTELFTGKARKLDAPAGLSEESDPVVGWLVIVSGPGTGHSIQIGVGLNTIGRGSDARCSMPFGDTLISSDDHIRIIYDDAGRAFHITPGSGKNVSRLNGQLLTQTTSLEDGSLIELSKRTQARFREFCGKHFDWSDLDDSASKTE